MPACKSCGEKWNWKQSIRMSLTKSADTGVDCPHCQKKQYLTKRSIKINNLFLFLLPLVIIISILLQVHFFLSMGIIVVTFVLMLVTYPFVVELSEDVEPL